MDITYSISGESITRRLDTIPEQKLAQVGWGPERSVTVSTEHRALARAQYHKAIQGNLQHALQHGQSLWDYDPAKRFYTHILCRYYDYTRSELEQLTAHVNPSNKKYYVTKEILEKHINASA